MDKAQAVMASSLPITYQELEGTDYELLLASSRGKEMWLQLKIGREDHWEAYFVVAQGKNVTTHDSVLGACRKYEEI